MRSAGIVALLVGIAGLALILAIIYVLVIPQTGAPTPTIRPEVEVTIYAGEIGDRYAFGLSPDNLTVPGPTIRIKVGEAVRIKLINRGEIPHSFVIVEEGEENPMAEPIFQGARIGSASRPLGPGDEGEAVFIPDKPGTYYYICSIPGHFTRGMWGQVIVTE